MNPKLIIKVVGGLIVGWLIVSSGERILDSYFVISDWFKFIGGLFILGLGWIKFGVNP